MIDSKGKEKYYSLSIPTSFKKTRLFKVGETKYMDPMLALRYILETQISIYDPCAVCGNKSEVEMHHVRHLRKNSVVEKGFTSLMSKVNRKQIPVCRSCHHKIHKGSYNGLSLKEL